MAGKAPLLLAMVLFGIGAIGLGLTSAERASWGPFQPRPNAVSETQVLVFDATAATAEPPALRELLPPPTAEPSLAAVLDETPETYVAAPVVTEAPVEPEPEATPTPLTPLRVFGISSDDGGVSAAAATPGPPPPIRIGGISFDEEPSTETPTTEPDATPSPE